ncbi:hypothetical protein STEG23_022285 [Scotinomys teguina]
MTVTPLGRDQDCSLKNRHLDGPAPWFLDPGGWSKTAVVSLYFIFPGICTLTLEAPFRVPPNNQTCGTGQVAPRLEARGMVTYQTAGNFGAPREFTVAAPESHRSCNAGSREESLILTQTQPGIFGASIASSTPRALAKPDGTSSTPTMAGNLNFPDLRDHVRALIQRFPLVDGHNDLPLVLRQVYRNGLHDANLRNFTYGQTSLNRLRDGFVGAQFWSAYVPCQTQDRDALRLTLEQIDLIHSMCTSYSELELVTSVKALNGTQKLACLIGVEGGHSLDNSLSVLRSFYQLEMRYPMLTQICNTPCSVKGLTHFAEKVVAEMNRLGVMVDLSHVSDNTARRALEVSQAPVIFSHSAARGVYTNARNLPDDILWLLRNNGGIVMVTFSVGMLQCNPLANVSTVGDHFDHIRAVIGSEFIGIGEDYDGTLQVSFLRSSACLQPKTLT